MSRPRPCLGLLVLLGVAAVDGLADAQAPPNPQSPANAQTPAAQTPGGAQDPAAATTTPETTLQQQPQRKDLAVWLGHVESDNLTRTVVAEDGSYENVGLLVGLRRKATRLDASIDGNLEFRHYSLDSLDNETVGTLIDLVQNQRSVRLEWYIIGPIGIEILLSLYQLFGARFR